jgi:hypothetical protein
MRNILLACAAMLASSELTRGEEATTQAELEKKFAETLSGAALVGFHTDSDKPAGKLTEERYILSKVSKLKDDYWLFMARIKYGERDMTLPLTLQVKWAGDTPIITLTDLAIPLLGKFSARVVIYEGSYAGTWSGAKHRGHLFGKIVKEMKEVKAVEEHAKDDTTKAEQP